MKKHPKKYPVIYKNDYYEVRWKEYYGYYSYTILCLYKEIFPFIKKKVFVEAQYDVDNLKGGEICKSDHSNYYVNEIKNLMKMYEKHLEKNENDQKRIKTLKDWNGII